jgi:protoporphyrinogen/coproporphyrinogen III oxidase
LKSYKNHIHKNVVIGAGIAGLSCAYKLQKLGEEFLLIEASNKVGGNWSSHKYLNSVYELGPNTLINRSSILRSIITELGLETEVLSETFKNSTRYLYLDQKFYEIGSNPLKVLMSGILSPWAIIRASFEVLVPRFLESSDESVYDFITRRFGKDIAERIIGPALQGIWAGDINTISSKFALKNLVALERKYGSVIKGALYSRKEKNKKTSSLNHIDLATISFRQGLEYLTNSLVNFLDKESVLLGKSVSTLQVMVDDTKSNKSQVYNLKLEDGTKLQAKNVFFATKAYQAATLIEPFSLSLSKKLNQIYYAPIFLLSFTLAKDLFENKKPKGFGFISAEKKDLVLGTIFSSELFPERSLNNEYLFTVFLGGAKNSLVLDLNESDLILSALEEEKKIFKNTFGIFLRDEDFNIVASKMINKAIPQYNVGHAELISQIKSELENFSGLHLLGNYIDGVSVADVLELTENEILLKFS